MARTKHMYVLAGLPGGPFYPHYRSGMYLIHVRAVSIRQAYYLAGNMIRAPDNRSVGVVKVEGP
jgi:hypothetical protein